MDLAYWGFSRWPFDRSRVIAGPDVGTAYDEALARMLFLIDERRRCGWLTGAPGTGKTRLLKQVALHVRRRGGRCVELDVAGIGGAEFAQQVARSLLVDDGASSVGRCWLLIQQQLYSYALIRQPVAILIDQWEMSGPDLPSSVRRLIGIAAATGADVTVLLASRFRHVAMELVDEVELSIELQPWTLEETSAYLEQSLQSVGSANLFDAEAVAAIHHATGGVPRRVIQIGDLSLLACQSEDRREVDLATVEAVTELMPQPSMIIPRPLVDFAVAS
jgi:general secretion pathway protein A